MWITAGGEVWAALSQHVSEKVSEESPGSDRECSARAASFRTPCVRSTPPSDHLI